MLIGRKEESELLKRLSQDEKSHFIAVYGRRRVGKTFLIRECFDYRFTFYHTGLSNGNMKKQLSEFVNSVAESGGEYKSEPKNWQEAFWGVRQLIKQSDKKRKVIFLDELSWMDTPRSDFMTALEAFWNGFASARKDIILIVCSSATSWMISNIIHNKGGLYNRLTESINLQTFTLKECEEYVQSMGLAFERICFLHTNQIKRKLGISGVQTEINSFYCKSNPDTGIFGSQIDMLIVRRDRVINVCEIKYSASEYTVNKDFADSMRRKINDLKTATGTKYAIFPTLITTYGIVYNSYSGEIQSHVTMDDLFE